MGWSKMLLSMLGKGSMTVVGPSALGLIDLKLGLSSASMSGGSSRLQFQRPKL